MKWNDLPHDARVRISQMDKEALEELAPKLGIKPITLIQYTSTFRNQDKVGEVAQAEGIRFPVQSTRRWDDFPVIEGEDAMVISDIESPDADLVWLETVLLMAIKHGIKRLILLGDISAGDQPGLATHLATWVESGQVDYKSSIGMLRKMIEIFLTWFEEINIISGNHDQRIAKATGGQVDLGTFLDHFGTRVQFSRYRKLYMKTHRGYIAMYHQANFSENGISVARKMYEQENWQQSHPYAVIVTHIHHWACGKSKDNLAEVYALGCSRDPALTQYKNETPTGHAQWSQSMILIRNGYIRNLERHSTDWQYELGEYFAKASIGREYSVES